MKIEKIILRDFRQFEELKLLLASRLNVLVGINGAGKTSVLDATAKMLSWCVRRLIAPTGGGSGDPLSVATCRVDPVKNVEGQCIRGKQKQLEDFDGVR